MQCRFCLKWQGNECWRRPYDPSHANPCVIFEIDGAPLPKPTQSGWAIDAAPQANGSAFRSRVKTLRHEVILLSILNTIFAPNRCRQLAHSKKIAIIDFKRNPFSPNTFSRQQVSHRYPPARRMQKRRRDSGNRKKLQYFVNFFQFLSRSNDFGQIGNDPVMLPVPHALARQGGHHVQRGKFHISGSG